MFLTVVRRRDVVEAAVKEQTDAEGNVVVKAKEAVTKLNVQQIFIETDVETIGRNLSGPDAELFEYFKITTESAGSTPILSPVQVGDPQESAVPRRVVSVRAAGEEVGQALL